MSYCGPQLLILALAGVLAVMSITGCNSAPKDDDRAQERSRMVDRQIAARGVRDRAVLAALRNVPRHRFVPADEEPFSYENRPLRIGHGQTISQPLVVAIMTEALQLEHDDRVLEIGTGSGYQAAVLAELVREVYSIEIVEPLARRAAKTLADLGYHNVITKAGDGYLGWPEHAPFDAIIVTAAPATIPKPLEEQLVVGGRLILPLGTARQELVLVTRTESGYERKNLGAVAFVPLTRR